MHVIKDLEGLYSRLQGVLETPFETNEARLEAVKSVIAGSVDVVVCGVDAGTTTEIHTDAQENTGESTAEAEKAPEESAEGEKQEGEASEEKEAAAAA